MTCDSHNIRLYCTQSILIPCTDPTRWTNKRREDRAKRCHIQTKTVKVHIFASIVWNIHCFMLGLRIATLSFCLPIHNTSVFVFVWSCTCTCFGLFVFYICAHVLHAHPRCNAGIIFVFVFIWSTHSWYKSLQVLYFFF